MSAEQGRRCQQENQDAIASMNEFMARHGLLADRMRLRREQRWLQENEEAFAKYDRRVAESGLLSDEAGLSTDHTDQQ
jgi:post-segregation antitoxin (ccd killing protein)